MARVYSYAMLSVGIVLVLDLIGIPTGMDSISNFLALATGELSFSEFFNNLFSISSGILLATVGAGIIIGIIARAQLENIILLPFLTGPLALLLGTFVRLIQNFSSATYPAWASNVLLVLMGMIGVGYIVSLAEWFRGNI